MITQNSFNKKPKTFMDYEPGKIPGKTEWGTQTKSETKAYNPFESNVKLVGDDITKKDYDNFFEEFSDPYGEKRKQRLQQKEQEIKEKLTNIRANANNQNRYQSAFSSQTDSFLDGFNQDSTGENTRILDSFREKTTDTFNPKLPNNAGSALNELQSALRDPQFERELKSTVQNPNPSPTITNAINHNLNAKNEYNPIGTYDPNKEPVITQFSNKPSSDIYDRTNKDVWSFEHDAPGVYILSHWLFGGGKDYIQEDGVWGNYMKSNEMLTSKMKNIVLPLADDLGLNDSKKVDITIPMQIENGESIIGYQYLHGTNADVGGFQIKGKVYKNEKGDVTYDLTYTWNDIIDPNYYYSTDAAKAEFAKSIPFANPKDYIIRISWHDKTKIKANPGWFNQNSGWLK